MTKTVALVDGNSILNRAYYALPVMNDSHGRNVNAVYGFINILLKVFNDYNPTHIAIAFDMKGKNFRHDLYDLYKANRKGMPDDLAAQLPILQDVLASMNITVAQKIGAEADDIIGTLSKRFDAKKLLVTGDRDLLQLIDADTTVLLTKKGISEVEKLDETALKSNHGMTPDQIVEYKALRGDPSDNIPGVKGVGEKTATDLIAKYGDIDNIYENIDEIKGSLKDKLTENKQMAYLSKTLATIKTDVDFCCEVDDCERKPYSPALKDKFVELEFRSLLKKIETSPETVVSAPKITCETSNVKTINELKKVVETLTKKDLTIYFGQQISLFTDGVMYLIEISDNFLDGISFADALSVIKPLLENETEKCVYDAKALKHLLDQYNIALNGVKWDVSIMQYLVEYRAFKNFETLTESYSVSVDAFGLSQVKDILERNLKKTGTQKLYFDIELPLMQVLYEMENEGVAVDTDFLDNLHTQYIEKINELTKQVYVLAGEEFNILSTKQLSEILFTKLKLPHYKKTKTGYSTDNDVLEKLADEHPIVSLIVQIRRFSKLNGTYVEGLKPLVKNGLLHTTYNQTLTTTGRLSSSEPNLQNIPIRNAEGRELRKMFVPKYDLLVSADYSQIELRLLAQFSGDKNLRDAFNTDKDIHTEVAADIFGVPSEMVTANMRRAAKAVNFGIIYGISDFGLSQNIGISQSKAREYIKKYFERYPTIKAYLDNSVEQAKRDGFITTIAGRRRFIPELKSTNYQLRMFGERAAMNMPLQGSSADIIKIAMINVVNKMKQRGLKSKLIMQVHDELIIDAYANEITEVENILKNEMENAVKLDVKLTVNIEKGGNLFESK
ncbi:MAG TPA: DNA polymerase I [Eubacteriales bacterium]|nr:DNA polymerase I [Eubacteriales bacterium]